MLAAAESACWKTKQTRTRKCMRKKKTKRKTEGVLLNGR